MKYTSEEQLQEVLRRRKRIIKKRKLHKIYQLSCVSAVLLIALSVCIPVYVGSGTAGSDHTNYGSFLLFPEAGSYLLVALIALIAGVVVTAVAIKYRNSRDKPKKDSETGDNGRIQGKKSK